MGTPQIHDYIWLHAGKKLSIHNIPAGPDTRTTKSLKEHAAKVDLEIGTYEGLVAPLGKYHVLSRGLWTKKDRTAIYGWHSDDSPLARSIGALPGIHVVQGLSGSTKEPYTGHILDFDNYPTEMVRVIYDNCVLDGKPDKLSRIITDPNLAHLISHQGAMQDSRHPGVEKGHIPWSVPSSSSPPPSEPLTPVKPTSHPTLRRGDSGDDVKKAQALLLSAGESLGRWGADGDFGSATEKATESFQSAHGLVSDGVIGSKTWAALESGGVPDTDPNPTASGDIPYIEAKNYTRVVRSDVRWIMMHTMEASEKPSTAEAVAKWFASSNAPRASAHYCVDSDNIIRCVPEESVGWGCGGANKFSVHYELAGYAKQSSEDWADNFSTKMLQIAAEYAAKTATRWKIPVEKIGPTDMRAGQPGFCGHVDGTKAFAKSDHYDPGKNFPWEKFLDMVKSFM